MSRIILHGTRINEDNNTRHDLKVTISKGTFKAKGTEQVFVSTPTLEDDSDVFMSVKTFCGTPGFAPVIVRKDAGTGFLVSCSPEDFSTYNYTIFSYHELTEKE